MRRTQKLVATVYAKNSQLTAQTTSCTSRSALTTIKWY